MAPKVASAKERAIAEGATAAVEACHATEPPDEPQPDQKPGGQREDWGWIKGEVALREVIEDPA